MTYGYVDEVVFPFTVDIKNLDDKTSSIEVKFLVCDEICVPEKAELNLVMKNGIINVDEEPQLLMEWMKRLPIRE